MDKTEKTINKLYDKLGFFDLYSGSLFFFIIITILLFLACSYLYLLINIMPIRNDWSAQRCYPNVIPFAGIINKPDDKTILEFTEENFTYCVQNTLINLTSYLLEPLTFLTSDLTVLYDKITDSFNNVRTFISNIRTFIANIFVELFGRLANFIIPLQKIIIKFKDFIAKVQGIFAASLYTLFGSYSVLQALFGFIAQVIILGLVIAFGEIIALWIVGFFFFPAAILAATSTVVYVVVLALLVVFLVFMADVLKVNITSPIPGVPGRPSGSCFDKNTLVKMNDGTTKNISEIKVGDILLNNNKVTATFILDTKNIDMYLLDGIIVSGTHSVKYRGNWIYVKDHPERLPIRNYNEPYIYCLNTETKTLQIKYKEFCDWDEIFDNEWDQLKKIIHDKSNISLDKIKKSDINKYFDEGFDEDTEIERKDGTKLKIKNIRVGELLRENVTVYGLVKIGEKKHHLLTDKNYFYISDMRHFDYNYCVEKNLAEFKKKY